MSSGIRYIAFALWKVIIFCISLIFHNNSVTIAPAPDTFHLRMHRASNDDNSLSGPRMFIYDLMDLFTKGQVASTTFTPREFKIS